MFSFPVLADILPTPKLTPQPATEQQSKLLLEGKKLHDEGQFELAIAKYEAVLKENADNVTAIYEMAFSYAGKKEYAKSQELALKAAQYKTDILPDVYILVGNNFDALGDYEKAVKVYQAGIKSFPDTGRLYFNLGIAYHNHGKIDDARKTLKQAVVAEPGHLTSHLVLGQIYYYNEYPIPALLALSRFLAAEPLSKRSPIALQLVEKILTQGLQKGQKPDEFTILFNPNEKKDEGDFTTESTMLSLLAAANTTEEERGKTELQHLTHQLSTLFVSMGEGKKKKAAGFGALYYAPFFVELAQHKFADAFAYVVFQRKNPAEAKKWLDANQNTVKEMRQWMAAYKWPKVKV
ncbi:MAG: tetratricopeptide repeat protein [Blastocatellia bacterium]|nr:tetratricopeptide repeat protein [Blastocatellia bacterium]